MNPMLKIAYDYGVQRAVAEAEDSFYKKSSFRAALSRLGGGVTSTLQGMIPFVDDATKARWARARAVDAGIVGQQQGLRHQAENLMQDAYTTAQTGTAERHSTMALVKSLSPADLIDYARGTHGSQVQAAAKVKADKLLAEAKAVSDAKAVLNAQGLGTGYKGMGFSAANDAAHIDMQAAHPSKWFRPGDKYVAGAPGPKGYTHDQVTKALAAAAAGGYLITDPRGNQAHPTINHY